jgi:hypothetical protein
VQPGQVAAHCQQKHRQRQHEADPEPARHVGEFVVRRSFRADGERFEGHAADRAAACPLLPYLRVHGAGVGAARLGGVGRAWLQVAVGVGFELAAAAGGTEMVRRAVVFGPMLGGGLIDLHAADGVDGFRLVSVHWLASLSQGSKNVLF